MKNKFTNKYKLSRQNKWNKSHKKHIEAADKRYRYNLKHETKEINNKYIIKSEYFIINTKFKYNINRFQPIWKDLCKYVPINVIKDPKISPLAKLIYLFINMCKSTKISCLMSNSQFSLYSGYSKRTIMKKINELKRKKLINSKKQLCTTTHNKKVIHRVITPVNSN